MLSFFRRIVNSKAGVFITLALLGVIALSFAAGDVTGLSSGGGGLLGNPVVTVGKTGITAADVRKRAQDEVRFAQTQQPGFDMAQLVRLGGVESIIERLANALGLEKFGHDQGIRVSRALIGSEIKTIAAFQGPTGQFDQATYERLIAQRGLTDAQVQDEFARSIMTQFLVTPTVGASQVSEKLALPYASLLLERREGQIALIPAAAVPAGAAPTDAEVQKFYAGHLPRYTVPERRVVRYAIVTPDSVKAQATPSDAEIQQAYNGNAAAYRPREQRTVSLVTVLDQKAADALAAKVKSGTALAAAARAAGLEPRTIDKADKAALATQSSAAVADALFAAQKGAVVGPIKGAIGFVVASVDAVTQVPGRTLAQARDEIVQTLTRTKTADALSQAQNKIDDALSDNANIAEVAADQKLSVATTKPLLASGIDPDDAATKPDPRLAPIMQAGFAAEEGDTPTIVALGTDGGFAVVGLDRVVRAAPRPLAQVRAQVVKDVVAERQRNAAKQIATQALAKLDKGATLPAVLAQTGVRGPAPQRIDTTRAQLNADRRGVDPTLALLFSMKQGSAKMLAAPNNMGWLLIKLDRVTPGDARTKPGVIAATRADLGRVIGQEYAQQFTRAAVETVGIKRKPDAIADLKRELAGQGGNQ
ncbi:SurA N-terminal domain-containing protein [Sphingomonas sp. RHCKR47]|uniref:peptidylprolyl isomerase n=1 Tax=Sphingomonas citricola TaxID=2862498 RepID=UPI001CA4E4CE|nr:peptidylprolyl isomerase [Sphingomonas citricola]MBW6522279.1 SurA N-terminal domain-containing protein [Sphingomonas citricola]